MNATAINFPLLLTLIRLILSPLLVPFLFATLLPAQSLVINLSLALIFIILSLTDFFDGFFARKYQQETWLGSLLDPIADKFLLLSTLVTLVYINKVYFYWAIIFIGREFFVMSLRQIALTLGFKLSVINFAKFKTCAQLIYLAWVIFNPYQNLGLTGSLFNILEALLLWIALGLSLFSAFKYYIIFSKNLKNYYLKN